MERYNKDRLLIQQNLKGIRNNEIRRKARFLILIMESKSVKEGCDKTGIIKQSFHRWHNRLKEHDFDLQCLANKSRKPHHSPNKTCAADEELIVNLNAEHGNSDRLLAIQFEKKTGRKIGHSTICAVLKRNDRVKKYRTIKPNSFNRRYSAPNPLDRVQADTLWTGLTDNNGNRVYMTGLIDDHSRFAYGDLNDEKGGFAATSSLQNFLSKVGIPKLVQTDNGTEFTNRYVSELNHKRQKEASKAAFETLLEKMEIEHHLIRPRTPQHNGKIERFNQTVLKEFSARVPDNLPLADYRKLFKAYLLWYNCERPHSSIKYLTPANVFYKQGMQIPA